MTDLHEINNILEELDKKLSAIDTAVMSAVNNADEGSWITINGARILIKDGESVGDAFKRSTGKDLGESGGSAGITATRHSEPSTKEDVFENMEWQKQVTQKTTDIAKENGWKGSINNKQSQEWEMNLYKPGVITSKSDAESLIVKLPKGEGITHGASFDELAEKWSVTVLVAR